MFAKEFPMAVRNFGDVAFACWEVGSVLTLDIFQKGRPPSRMSIVRTDPFSSRSFVFHRHRRASLFFARNQGSTRELCQQYLSVSVFQSLRILEAHMANYPGASALMDTNKASGEKAAAENFNIYFGQAARSFAAISLYSASGSFLLGAGVPGAFPPKEGMT